MKIYLASTAPGNETQREKGMLSIPTRLLSYYHIRIDAFGSGKVFEAIKKLKEETNEDILSREL